MSRDANKLKGCEPTETEGFVSRWSRRKMEDRAVIDENKVSSKTPPAGPHRDDQETGHPSVYPLEQPTDADMPPLDSLGEDSDYSGFMSPKVSEELRTLALRKLFHLPQFNVTDGLNDYDEDYTSFAKLGTVLTHEMRRLLELEEKLNVNGEKGVAKSKTSDLSKLEDSTRLEPDAGTENTDEIGSDEKDKT